MIYYQYIYTSTYLLLCYFPNIHVAPKSSKKLFNRCLPYSALTSPPVTAWTPSSSCLPFARFPRAGCFAYIHYENSSLSRFSWPNPGVFISFFNDVNPLLLRFCTHSAPLETRFFFSPHTAACATQWRGDREHTALWAHSKVVEGFLCRFTRYQKNSGEEGLAFVHSLLRPLPFSCRKWG